MNPKSKTLKENLDKNALRIEKQVASEQKVKKGDLAHPDSSREGQTDTNGNVGAHFPSGSSNRPIFAVDPEIERQMAAQGVVPQSKAKKQTPEKSIKSTSDEKHYTNKSENSTRKKKSVQAGGVKPKLNVWDKKGNPKFASSDDQLYTP